MGDFHHLTDPAAIPSGTAAVGPIFLTPDDQGSDGLVHLDRGVAHA